MRSIGDTLGNQARKLKAVASGALPNGDPVIVNSDGTVTVVAEESITQGFGSGSVFYAGTAGNSPLVYDASNQKIVVIYGVTAVVGTVSGDSISFGTPTQFFDSSGDEAKITYDSANEKVVIAFKKSSGGISAVVGTISGTSISFGTVATVDTDSLLNVLDLVYDAGSGKVVVAYPDGGSSNYGKVRVGTVSGTSITFGSPSVTFESSTVINVNVAYDAAAEKVVIIYTKTSNNRGTAVVGTVSGSSISYGTKVEFETGSTGNLAIAYDAGQEKVLIGFRDGGDSDKGKAIVGTVSGTSISFGTAAVFNDVLTVGMRLAYHESVQKCVMTYADSNGSKARPVTISGTTPSFGTVSDIVGEYVNIGYDASANRMVITYRDTTNSNYGTAFTMTLDETVVNLTAENYIGIASSGYADTQGATIDIQGSINSNQSGLTAGQAYYVQTDGTLDTTPADPSVFAGTALTATKLLVKG